MAVWRNTASCGIHTATTEQWGTAQSTWPTIHCKRSGPGHCLVGTKGGGGGLVGQRPKKSFCTYNWCQISGPFDKLYFSPEENFLMWGGVGGQPGWPGPQTTPPPWGVTKQWPDPVMRGGWSANGGCIQSCPLGASATTPDPWLVWDRKPSTLILPKDMGPWPPAAHGPDGHLN